MINGYRVTLRWLICTLLFTASLCVAESNPGVDPAGAFGRRGPIFIGRITSIKDAVQNSTLERGTVVIDVSEQLRGEPLPQSLNLPFRWTDDRSPSFFLSHAKGPLPTGFDRVRPVVGMQVLVFLNDTRPTETPASEVLDLSTHSENWVSIVKSAVARDRLPDGKRTNELLDALSDPVKFTREVALVSLLQGAQCWNGTSCRSKAVAIECHRSKTGPEAERVEAINALWEFYDPTAKNKSTNRHIVSDFFSLIPDHNKQVRRAAITYARFVYFSGGNWVPNVNTLDIPDRAAVIDVLEKEQARRTEGAKHLADLLLQGK